MEKKFKLKGKIVIVNKIIDNMVLSGKPKVSWLAGFEEDWGKKHKITPPMASGKTAKEAFEKFRTEGIKEWESYNKRKYPF